MPGVRAFKEALERFDIDTSIIELINEGHEKTVDKSPKKTKAQYFKAAVDIMVEKVDAQTIQDVFECCACCKSGARLKSSKAFAKENTDFSVDEKIKKIKFVPNMGQPVKNEDGTITVNAVSYKSGEKYFCACPNFSGLNYDVQRAYCFCCAGHFKYHYEIMLGVKLKTLEIVSSPLDSKGENPCVIKFALI